jgi:hypothetical protein
MSAKRYRSREAAERAALRVRRDVPSALVKVNSDNSLTVHVHSVALTPEQRQTVAEHDVQTPKAPNPKTPLLPPLKPRTAKEPSTVREPVKVAREVFTRYYAEGRIDDRKAAIDEAIAAGVTPNTASTIYYTFRADLGLPASVRKVRALQRSPVSLKATPAAVRVCNGVTEPSPGTKAREVWDMADALHAKWKRPPKRGEVREKLPGLTLETVKKAYVAWRRFHAIPQQHQHHNRSRIS